jgi:RNA-binding protein YhbY
MIWLELRVSDWTTPIAEIEECLEIREIVAVNIAGDCVESTNITSEVVTQNEVAAMKKIC